MLRIGVFSAMVVAQFCDSLQVRIARQGCWNECYVGVTRGEVRNLVRMIDGQDAKATIDPRLNAAC